MSSVTLDGVRANLKGHLPKVGEDAPDFTFVAKNLQEKSLIDDFDGLVKVIISVPSIDTGVCRKETRTFNEELGKREGVVGIVVSRDLPFAQNRFCEGEGISNIVTASDYRYQDFGQEYNAQILDGAFKGLLARAVFVVDKSNVIQYAELVPEIGQEPRYESILRVVDQLVS